MSLQIVSVLDKNVCTAEEYSRSLRDGTITCLTKGDTMGLLVIVEAGLVSLGAILCLFAIITRNTIWRRRHIREARLRLFHKPMDLLMFCVLLADIIQAIGMVLNLRWILLGKVELGTFCTTQGFIKLIGSTAVALFTLAIAIYTFLGVWMARDIASLGLTFGVVMAIWVLNASLAVVGPLVNMGEGNPSYMSVAPYWCSTSKHYLLWKTMSDYIFRWITLFSSILIYIPLYLWLRGNLVFDEAKWWKLHFRRTPKFDANLRGIRKRSLMMLAYPLVYCILILPLTIVRWITWWVPRQYQVPAAATFATDATFGLSGFFNVILLVTTRPETGLFGQLMFEAPARPPSILESEGNGEMADDDYRLARLPSG